MTEHDEYMKTQAKKNASMVEKLSAKYSLRRAQQKHKKADEEVQRATAVVDIAAKNFYEVWLNIVLE